MGRMGTAASTFNQVTPVLDETLRNNQLCASQHLIVRVAAAMSHPLCTRRGANSTPLAKMFSNTNTRTRWRVVSYECLARRLEGSKLPRRHRVQNL